AADFVQPFEQLNEGAFSVRRADDVAAGAGDDLPEQRAPARSVRRQFLDLTSDLLNRARAFFSACFGNDATGAGHVSALHDGNERADLPAAFEMMVFDGVLRPGLVLQIDDRRRTRRPEI